MAQIKPFLGYSSFSLPTIMSERLVTVWPKLLGDWVLLKGTLHFSSQAFQTNLSSYRQDHCFGSYRLHPQMYKRTNRKSTTSSVNFSIRLVYSGSFGFKPINASLRFLYSEKFVPWKPSAALMRNLLVITTHSDNWRQPLICLALSFSAFSSTARFSVQPKTLRETSEHIPVHEYGKSNTFRIEAFMPITLYRAI
uniref:Uncharacterized protein n=1 Tax=Setaria digitata TaxID=48799 RepID=A0A915Q223_9BILA